MAHLIIGVIAGAAFSWIVTHIYYKLSIRKTSQNDPLPLIQDIAQQIKDIRLALVTENPGGERLNRSLLQVERRLRLLHHVYSSYIHILVSRIKLITKRLHNKEYDKLEGQEAEIQVWLRRLLSSLPKDIGAADKGSWSPEQ